MSDPIALAQQKINLALNLLFEAQQLLDAQIDSTQPIFLHEVIDEEDTDQHAVVISKEEAIASLFQAAIDEHESEEEILSSLSRFMHSSILSSSHALSSLIRFNWSRLCSQTLDYLADPKDPKSFSVVREQIIPNQATEMVKVFLNSTNRNPTPCTLQKENSGDWKILTFSL